MLSRTKITALFLCVMLVPALAQSQTPHANFEIIKRHPDYKNYRYFDECTSAIGRMGARSSPEDSILLDTMRFDPLNWPRIGNDSVVEIGRRCIGNELLATLDKRSALAYAPVLLQVGMVDEAVELVIAFLDSLPYTEAINAVVSSIITSSGSSSRMVSHLPNRPFNPTFYKRLADHVVSRVPGDSIYLKSLVKFTLWRAIEYMKDPDRDRIKEEWTYIDKGILEAEKTGIEGEIIKMTTRCRHDLVRLDEEELDSIRVSNHALETMVRAACADMGTGVDEMNIGITGKAIPEVPGDYWFSGNNHPPFPPIKDGSPSFTVTQRSVRPVPGKINLIVVLNNECHRQTPRNLVSALGATCNGMVASVRRVLKEHPDVELTIVSQGRGFLGLRVEPDPKKEAELLAELIFGHYRLPGVLAVVNTPYFRLENSDGRRINNLSELSEFLGQLGVRELNTSVLLIDQEGVGVLNGFISPLDETRWIDRIEAIKKRK